MLVHTCTECAAGIVNDDWSHLDYHDDPQAADEQHASILGTPEILGWLTPIGTVDLGGYYDCEICGSVNIGTAHTFESERG